MNTQKKNNSIFILKEHVDIINQNAEELIRLESEMEEIQKRIKAIKNDKWKKACNYFYTAKHRKYIKEIPNKENGYTIKFFKNTEFIEKPNKKDILTKKLINEILKSLNEDGYIKEDETKSINLDDLKMISSQVYDSVKEYITNK